MVDLLIEEGGYPKKPYAIRAASSIGLRYPRIPAVSDLRAPPTAPACPSEPLPLPARRSRLEQVAGLSRAAPGLSQRQQAQQLGLSRGGLRHRQHRQQSIGAPALEVEFFESPAGLDLLQRIQVAIQITITLLGSGGVRQVCLFLEWSGLSRHVASSYGYQQALNRQIEEGVVAYCRHQREQLRVGMPSRDITVCEDETYHPQTCLVSLEPVSGFILLERYAEDRSADTWDQALQEATQDLPVKIIQVTSDRAKGLLRHAGNLGAQAAPDLFHLQRDLVKATALALLRAERHAEAALVAAQEAVVQAQQDATAYRSQAPRPGRPSQHFERRVHGAELQQLAAQVDLEQARQRREQARQEIRALSEAYHPYQLDTGQVRTVEHLQAHLAASWERLDRLAREASLPERCRQLLDKAKALTPALLLTLQFFITTCQAKLEALNLSPELEALLQHHWIPALYLDRVAERCGKAEARQRFRQISQTLLRPLRQADSPLAALNEAERRCLEAVAVECADLFQRSSSAVEGRNGHLALHHHGQHRLSDRRLAAKTTLHNCMIRRPDGTTAAQRFFGRRPDDLFQWVLGHVKPPARPARKRPRPPKPVYLQRNTA